jgi:hypothetical protein
MKVMREELIEMIKADLKRFNSTSCEGFTFKETVKMVNNWNEYTGKYNVYRSGDDEPINDLPVTIDKAIDIAIADKRKIT